MRTAQVGQWVRMDGDAFPADKSRWPLYGQVVEVRTGSFTGTKVCVKFYDRGGPAANSTFFGVVYPEDLTIVPEDETVAMEVHCA